MSISGLTLCICEIEVLNFAHAPLLPIIVAHVQRLQTALYSLFYPTPGKYVSTV